MTHAEIHRQLTGVFRDIFDDPALEISDSTTANDVEDWDSITHIDLINAVENSFHIKLNTKDVKGLQNVGDFIRLLAGRIK
ncbi:MAG TPA: phosphopantetheine-binding protein [Steroidobacteraceae bacterium]|jgi:acyl carrier protein|nr:phosphopantetheine-binding protein [Steroidobacteraceae bacterium]